jgi:P-type Ca2+ transporter type 2C
MTSGLSSADAALRRSKVGPNQVEKEQAVSALRLVLAQFSSPVIWLLLGACAVSALLGERLDAIAIAAIVVLNAVVGFVQEYRAERAVLALRSMTAPRARVLRDGRATTIAAIDVVPDDVLLLEAGDLVAADARLLEASELLLNESALTGESAPVQKNTRAAPAGAALAERHGSVFMGTAVANGTGSAVVVATGMATELGKVAHLLSTAQQSDTPLQVRLARVSRVLLYLCVGVVAAVATTGLLRGVPWMDVLLMAVSLAVAAVPEGLPAVVTIALALGVQRMVSHNVLVRHLPAVETLGCATVICTDKTGTLTTGVMTVREVWSTAPAELLDAACACCDAELDPSETVGTGDPTEVALLVAGVEHDIRRAKIEQDRPRVATHPFDSDRKRMSIKRADGVLYVKGAIEATLPLCIAGTEGAEQNNERMAAAGLRVLAVAVGHGDREADLKLLGLVGIADPPRPEAIHAVAAARSAGIRTVMITGDHPITARAIAKELGILGETDDPTHIVHARATPEDKLTIVRHWKEQGEVVAMTGDGVNDAPALREAHIGVAMGKAGTEVSREAADLILTDDNFASVVAAIREGRGIFENIRKTLVYLLSGNAAELTVMLGAALLGLPLPLLPLQLLWINLVTDGLPALALVTDPIEGDVMKQPPRRNDEPMLAREQWLHVGWTALLQAAVCLGVFAWALEARNLTTARDLAFSALAIGELFRAFSARSNRHTFLTLGLWSNPRLLSVVLISVGVQLGLHYVPWTQSLFQLEGLSLADCGLVLALGALPTVLLELNKVLRKHWPRKQAPKPRSAPRLSAESRP